ncbi:MAG: NTP transferase domain-containing protein [Lentimicrobium sp.]|nr:NTP transferase domain-containing protein [Lentimicrobium sp.]
MGRHKALLPFGDHNVTFLERIVNVYMEANVNQIVVVVNQELFNLMKSEKLYIPEKVSVIVNRHPETGRFHSLKTGLECIAEGDSVFFQNVDNPFVSEDVLNLLFESRDLAGVILPVFSGRSGHPVLLSPEVCKSIRSTKVQGERIDLFLQQFALCKVETNDARILVNINTEYDYYMNFREGT